MTKERAKYKAQKRREWADLAEKKAAALQAEYDADPRSNDWAFWSEPIKTDHYSARSHQRARDVLNNKKQKIFDLLDKAKMHREKADNLERFANTNKGDAERKRESERKALDQVLTVGSMVYSALYRREGRIVKVNTKTYRIDFGDWSATQDKTYVEPLAV